MVKGVTAKIHVDPQACPRFCRPRSVPFAMKQKIEEELERLLKEGIIEPVQFSEWAAPIVPVRKSDGSVRICGDYRMTINQASKLDAYPLPKIEDLFTSLSRVCISQSWISLTPISSCSLMRLQGHM